jgi:hypothetical protein
MTDADRLTPASSEDLADALAFALRYSGRKRTHDAGEMMAAIVAKRLVKHLERSGFVGNVRRRFSNSMSAAALATPSEALRG